jgi:hypothetical protein
MNASVIPTGSTYAAPSSRDALNRECLERTITGRPLPDEVAPRVPLVPCPPSASEGIEGILRGP